MGFENLPENGTNMDRREFLQVTAAIAGLSAAYNGVIPSREQHPTIQQDREAVIEGMAAYSKNNGNAGSKVFEGWIRDCKPDLVPAFIRQGIFKEAA